MAKDTNTSECPAMVSGCKFGHTVKTDLSKCNDGFIVTLSVVNIGYSMGIKEIKSLSSSLYYLLNYSITKLEDDLVDKKLQPSLDFFGDDEPAF